MDRLYLRFHRPITDLGPGLGAMEGVCTHGGDPLNLLLVDQTPSPDSHLSWVHQSQRRRDHVRRSIKVYVQRGKIQMVFHCHGGGISIQ